MLSNPTSARSWRVAPKMVPSGIPYGAYSGRTGRDPGGDTAAWIRESEGAGDFATRVGLLAAAFGVSTFLVGPFVVKAIAPDWSYGRRLAASLAFGIVTGFLLDLRKGK